MTCGCYARDQVTRKIPFTLNPASKGENSTYIQIMPHNIELQNDKEVF
jgi:hypothetical protein